jgi:hypothetical protein
MLKIVAVFAADASSSVDAACGVNVRRVWMMRAARESSQSVQGKYFQ